MNKEKIIKNDSVGLVKTQDLLLSRLNCKAGKSLGPWLGELWSFK